MTTLKLLADMSLDELNQDYIDTLIFLENGGDIDVVNKLLQLLIDELFKRIGDGK